MLLFSDVSASHWAAGYVNVASNYGIIVGVGAGLFAPDKEVSVAEFYTMAVRALNAGKLVDSEGTWPTNYVNFAIENGLAEDVAQVYSQTATRITAAIIAANTLEAPMWEKSAVKSNGEITWEAKSKKIVEDVLKLQAYANATDKKDSKSYTVKVKSVSNIDHYVTPETGSNIKVVDDLDLSNIKAGMTYEYWMNDKDKIVGLWLPKSSEAIEFTEIKKYKAVASGKDEVTLVVDGKEEVYKLDDETASLAGVPTIVENEVTLTVSSKDDIFKAGTAGAADTGALKARKNIRGTAYVTDGVLSQVYITEFKAFAAVKDATDKKVTFQSGSDYVGFTSTSLSLTTKDKEYFLTKDGKAMSFSDLKEDDVIMYYTVTTGANKIVAEVVEAADAGKVTSIKYSAANKIASIKVNGKSYDVVNADWTIKTDDEITIYLNDAGKVAAYVKDKEAVSDYGYINYARIFNDGYGDNLEITLVLSDGTVTDKMVINKDETKKKYNNTAVTIDSTNKVAKVNSDVIAKLGMVVCFEVKNGKVVIKPVSEDPEYVAITTPASGNNLVVTNKTTVLDGFYLTDNTKVYKLKTISNKDYEYSVETINVEDLDDTQIKTGSFVAGIDKDTKEISTLYISTDSSVARTGEANFAFITNIWSTKDGDDDVNEVEVILLNGSKESYIVSNDVVLANYGVGDTYEVGQFVDLTVNNDKVTKIDMCAASGDDSVVRTVANNVIVKNVANSRYSYVSTSASITPVDASSTTITAGTDTVDGKDIANNITTGTYFKTAATKYFTTAEKAYASLASEFILADDLLVLEVNSKGDKWTVREMSDIENYVDYAELTSSKTLDVVTTFATYVEENGDTPEVVLVIFKNDVEKQN